MDLARIVRASYNSSMRLTVSPEQLKFFQLNGFLEVEHLLDPKEAALLLSKIALVRKNSPGYAEENLFRSIPYIAEVAKKRSLGHLLAQLIHKKPLRLKSDLFLAEAPSTLSSLEEDCYGLLINLHACKGLFFKKAELPQEFHRSPRGDYLLLILTSQFLPTPPHPILAA